MLVQRAFSAFSRNALATAAGAILLALSSSARAAPVTIPTATASALQGMGQGLCVANAISTKARHAAVRYAPLRCSKATVRGGAPSINITGHRPS